MRTDSIAFHLWGQQHAWLQGKKARTSVSWAAAPVNELPLSCWWGGWMCLLNRKPCKPGIKRKPWWWQEAQEPPDRRCHPQWKGVHRGSGERVLCFGRRYLTSVWSLLRQSIEEASKCLCWFPGTWWSWKMEAWPQALTCLPCFLLAVGTCAQLYSAQASFF